MKFIAVLMGVLLAGSVFAEIPKEAQGTFAGLMRVRDQTAPDKVTEMDMQAEVTATTLRSIFSGVDFVLTLTEKEQGFFDVSTDGMVVGKGHCLVNACSYEINLNDSIIVIETLVLIDTATLPRYGSIQSPGGPAKVFHAILLRK